MLTAHGLPAGSARVAVLAGAADAAEERRVREIEARRDMVVAVAAAEQERERGLARIRSEWLSTMATAAQHCESIVMSAISRTFRLRLMCADFCLTCSWLQHGREGGPGTMQMLCARQ